MKTPNIVQLILNGDVDEAISQSCESFDKLSLIKSSDIVYFEPRMQNAGGHFCRLASTYENLFSSVNLDTVVLHHLAWDADERPEWHGVFSIPDHIAGIGQITTQSQLEGFSRYFEHIYHEGLQKTSAGLAVFSTSRFLTILAAVRAVERSPGVVGAILGVMETGDAPDCDNHTLITGSFKSAARLIVESNKTFMIFAESDSIRKFLLSCGFPADRVMTNPYPAAHRFQEPDNDKSDTPPHRFGSLAGTRAVQNPGLLANFLLNTTHQSLNWTIRLKMDLAAAQLVLDVAELRHALQNASINLLEDSLSEADYDLVLQTLQVMLLPYGERYETIGSGIFLESICAGIVPLVPAGSTMRHLYLQLGGAAPAIEEMSVKGLETTIANCIPGLEKLQENARQVRQAWLSHENGPVAWSRHVLSLVQNAKKTTMNDLNN